MPSVVYIEYLKIADDETVLIADNYPTQTDRLLRGATAWRVGQFE